METDTGMKALERRIRAGLLRDAYRRGLLTQAQLSQLIRRQTPPADRKDAGAP